MESTLTEQQREDVWEALSDAFIDNEVHYEFIARRIAGIPKAELQEIFFNEVAPQCGPNLLATIPPIWAGFDKESLAKCIRDMLQNNRRSRWARIRHRITVALFRRRFRRVWERIEFEWARKAQHTGS
ncbi:hypothetical protein [Thiomonas sp. FB-6]|uniref:DUF7079 family protein n=1 Tax=Thiomonas sp. FB-6 TaxID=1158291 RepID=UPI0003784C97|nr:hypothetical protein [Thiomonas sp. FB-6]